MIYRLINPSDGILFEGDDDTVAFAACVLLSRGQYALETLGDKRMVCPMMFRGEEEFEEECKRAGAAPFGEYVRAHRKEVATFLRSVFYGRSVEDLEAFKTKVATLSDDDRRAATRTHNNVERSSGNNIEGACLDIADFLEQMK